MTAAILQAMTRRPPDQTDPPGRTAAHTPPRSSRARDSQEVFNA
jgi:hypothetical protein